MDSKKVYEVIFALQDAKDAMESMFKATKSGEVDEAMLAAYTTLRDECNDYCLIFNGEAHE